MGASSVSAWLIYADELWETAAALGGALVGRWLVEQGRLDIGTARWALVLLTFLDLWRSGPPSPDRRRAAHRLIEPEPGAGRLAQEPRGTRIADDRLRNMPMLVGLAPISAYRTLNLPAVPELTVADAGTVERPAVRASGSRRRYGRPARAPRARPDREPEGRTLLQTSAATPRETIDDPGPGGLALRSRRGSPSREPGHARFSIWRAEDRPVRAWLAPLTTISGPGDARRLVGRSPRHPRRSSTTPSRSRPSRSGPRNGPITVSADEPAWVIVSQLADPQWKARWIGLDDQGERSTAEILPAFRKRGRTRGLAACRGSRLGPLDATIGVRRARRGRRAWRSRPSPGSRGWWRRSPRHFERGVAIVPPDRDQT